jgi:hypothetical protein
LIKKEKMSEKNKAKLGVLIPGKTSVPHYLMRHTLKHLLHMNHHSDSFFTYFSSTIFLVDTKSPA